MCVNWGASKFNVFSVIPDSGGSPDSSSSDQHLLVKFQSTR